MTALSLHLPNNIAKASDEAAHKLGLSRTAFIRQAIIHEIENLQIQVETKAMADSFAAMKTDRNYREEMETLERGLNLALPQEKTQWWKKKKKKKKS